MTSAKQSEGLDGTWAYEPEDEGDEEEEEYRHHGASGKGVGKATRLKRRQDVELSEEGHDGEEKEAEAEDLKSESSCECALCHRHGATSSSMAFVVTMQNSRLASHMQRRAYTPVHHAGRADAMTDEGSAGAGGLEPESDSKDLRDRRQSAATAAQDDMAVCGMSHEAESVDASSIVQTAPL